MGAMLKFTWCRNHQEFHFELREQQGLLPAFFAVYLLYNGTAGKVETADFRRTILIIKLLKSSFLNFALLD